MRRGVLRPSDAKWLEVLSRAQHDVYHLPSYCSFVAQQEGGEAFALYASTGAAECLIPLVLRRLPEWLDVSSPATDAASPYGYASPLFVGTANGSEFEACLDGCIAAASDLAIVSMFLRLHPLFPNENELIAARSTVVTHGETVFVDLSSPERVLTAELASGHRYEIRRLARLGFTTGFDDWSGLTAFAAMYRQTMERVGAAPYYQFSDDYFSGLREALGPALHLCLVNDPNGVIAAGALFTELSGMMQYHLSGTHHEFVRLAPTKLALSDTIMWGRERNCRIFHLGGGVGGRPDSLFRFKAGFSPSRADFLTSRLVIDYTLYQQLLEAWQEKARGTGAWTHDFFPAYRQPLCDRSDIAKGG